MALLEAGIPGSRVRRRPKINEFPSGDQAGSTSPRSSDTTSSEVPPFAGTINILELFPGIKVRNAIRFPSGDQRGRAAAIGGYVSCSRSLPFNLLLQSILSG